MIKCYEIDKGLAVLKWGNLEDMALFADIIQKNSEQIYVKSLNKEILND